MINYQNRNPKLKVPTHSLRTSRRQRVSLKSLHLCSQRDFLCAMLPVGEGGLVYNALLPSAG